MKLRIFVLWAVFFFFLSADAFSAVPQTPKGNSQSQSSPFRLVSSASGTKVTIKNEQYVIEDPKNVFHVPADNKIVVVLNWQGPSKVHHFQASWVDPSGKIIAVETVDLQSPGSDFSCSWTLNLTDPESIRPGLWALESQIDGLPASAYTFQIVSDTNASQPAPVPSASDVYRRVLNASAFVDNLDADGNVIRQGSAFFIAKGLLVTAFQVIDGATSLRIELPDGQNAATDRILAWNRWQDWAILKIDVPGGQVLDRAPVGSWKVGDQGYLLDANDSGRTIQNVGITGIQQLPEAGERINTSWWGSSRTTGSPLLDKYGRVIGVLGGSLIPGIETVRQSAMGNYAIVGQPFVNSFVPLVVPISLVPSETAPGTPNTLAQIAAKGEFVRPIQRDRQLAFATLCKAFQRIGDVALVPTNQTTQFSRQRDTLKLVVTWAPNKKENTSIEMRVFDLNNQLVEESKPAKIDLRPQKTAYSAISMPIVALKPGIYRADLLLGNSTEWRAFFKVVE